MQLLFINIYVVSAGKEWEDNSVWNEQILWKADRKEELP